MFGLARLRKLHENPEGDSTTLVKVGGKEMGAMGGETVITKPRVCVGLPVSTPAPAITSAPMLSVPTPYARLRREKPVRMPLADAISVRSTTVHWPGSDWLVSHSTALSIPR